ncbi:protein arginine N-methyltransferase 1.5-like [Abrus precatorius]|uniref:Protein arginine N-methyltransferase n=1 Tax=Abrus precatorius TaxID=3816 RepID=A0A8B8JQN7_ABRPR|nr:protein arginine N-methyltransferase 1.5-like [Abrus precatorius]
MPLGNLRKGDSSDSNLCGIEADFDFEISCVVDYHVKIGEFDFVVAPLIDPEYRPSLKQAPQCGSFEEVVPFVEKDISMSPTQFVACVIGKISTWIDLDSENESLRTDSETVLKKELDWASYLSLRACLLPAPKGTFCANYARCVNQIMHSLQNSMQLWIRIPVGETVDDSLVDYWKTWNSFRLLCEHHSRLWVALDNLGVQPSDDSIARWYGEPVAAFIMRTDSFLSNQSDSSNNLPMHLQKLIIDCFNRSIQFETITPFVRFFVLLVRNLLFLFLLSVFWTSDSGRYPLQPYRDHIVFLYKRMDPLTERERIEFRYRDFPQKLFQPLKINQKALTYHDNEKDATKYKLYKKAICQALLDRVPDEKASEITLVLVVVGAGRGCLVKTSVQAAKETGRKLKVYAVEKNPNALGALNGLVMAEDMEDIVTIVTSDVRYWNAPETADILVSEMLGTFGDSELSPECLDGAQRFLKEDGISIPSSYTSFLHPVTASKLYDKIKAEKDILRFESAFIVKLLNVTQLAPSQPVFTFTHPKHHSDKESNSRHKKLLFFIPDDRESVMVHGFAGYFDATLYKDVRIGTEPSTATPKVFTWYAMFFPLRTPTCLHRGSSLEVHFWRCCDSTKVWYEWCVTSPTLSPIHNSNGAFDLNYVNNTDFLGSLAISRAKF